MHLLEQLRAQSLQSCPTLWDPMDSSPPGSSVQGILQARILEWVAMPSSRGSSCQQEEANINTRTQWHSPEKWFFGLRPKKWEEWWAESTHGVFWPRERHGRSSWAKRLLRQQFSNFLVSDSFFSVKEIYSFFFQDFFCTLKNYWIPGRGAKILHALQPENQNIKQKHYCNKFNKD